MYCSSPEATVVDEAGIQDGGVSPACPWLQADSTALVTWAKGTGNGTVMLQRVDKSFRIGRLH